MTRTTADPLGPHLEALWNTGTLTGLRDEQLLARFQAAKDTAAESAFRELMHRHGPMVMGVCRQILRRSHDADDAFQATFLVLVRKSGSIRAGRISGAWLYAVAYRTAHRARTVAALPPGTSGKPGTRRGRRCVRRLPVRSSARATRRAQPAPRQIPSPHRFVSRRGQDARRGRSIAPVASWHSQWAVVARS